MRRSARLPNGQSPCSLPYSSARFPRQCVSSSCLLMCSDHLSPPFVLLSWAEFPCIVFVHVFSARAFEVNLFVGLIYMI
jgi:hypothetical protein